MDLMSTLQVALGIGHSMFLVDPDNEKVKDFEVFEPEEAVCETTNPEALRAQRVRPEKARAPNGRPTRPQPRKARARNEKRLAGLPTNKGTSCET